MPVATRGSAKRARDESDVSEEERAAKRPSTPFFRRVEPSLHERTRSARKATPARAPRQIRSYSEFPITRFRDENAADLPQLMPTFQEASPSRAVNPTPATPSTPERTAQQSRIGWLWNSARRYIPGLRGEDTEAATQITTQTDPERSASPSPSDGMPPANPLDIFALPFERPRPEPEPEDSVAETLRRIKAMKENKIEDFNWVKRNKKWDYASAVAERDQRAAKFNTKQVRGSNKRKITEDPEDAGPSTPPRNSFQPPSVEDDDGDDSIQVVATSKEAEVLLKTPEKQPQVASTPLKSAIRTGTKSKLNVGFDESTIKSTIEPEVQTKWRNYGPAGHYTGTTFLDPTDPKNKKHFQKLAEDSSPELITNKDPKFSQSNTFGICDEDIEYGELSADDEEHSILIEATPTAPPSAPRPSHAELPAGPKQGDPIAPGQTQPGVTNDASRLSKPNATGEKALEEQRARANKYKPKNSSGLSHVEPARSRSSSPPRSSLSGRTAMATAPADDIPALSDDNGDASDEPTSPTPSPSQILASDIGASILPRELDNTIRGEDGMTDYEREHQHDSWAAGLDWPEPQTYVEAGVCSAYIDGLLRKKFTKEDERITRVWWQKEFNDVDRAMEEAKRNGQTLELVYGDDIESIE